MKSQDITPAPWKLRYWPLASILLILATAAEDSCREFPLIVNPRRQVEWRRSATPARSNALGWIGSEVGGSLQTEVRELGRA